MCYDFGMNFSSEFDILSYFLLDGLGVGVRYHDESGLLLYGNECFHRSCPTVLIHRKTLKVYYYLEEFEVCACGITGASDSLNSCRGGLSASEVCQKSIVENEKLKSDYHKDVEMESVKRSREDDATVGKAEISSEMNKKKREKLLKVKNQRKI